MDATFYKNRMYGGGGAVRGNFYDPIIYSTEEREVGVWTDNKPLYQKTWVLSTPITLNANTWVTTTIDHTALSLDKLVNAFANSGADIYNGIQASTGTGSYIEVLNYRYARFDTLTLQYTKTTDVAGSGKYNTLGVPNVHYSTDEQVIGTWIDGKPLYQKTYNINETIHNQDKTIDVSSLNIKKYINGYGTFMRNIYWASPAIYIETPFNLYESNANHSYLRYGKSSNTIDYGVTLGNNETATDITITIQYTKTTD